MREIKFRAWVGKMEYDITTGKFVTFFVNSGAKGDGLDPKDSATLTPFNTKYHDNAPVMQFTGLKERNGVDVYEGDILKNTNSSPLEVYWDTTMAAFYVRCGGWNDMLEGHTKNYNKIGNIYENPDLLTNN